MRHELGFGYNRSSAGRMKVYFPLWYVNAAIMFAPSPLPPALYKEERNVLEKMR